MALVITTNQPHPSNWFGAQAYLSCPPTLPTASSPPSDSPTSKDSLSMRSVSPSASPTFPSWFTPSTNWGEEQHWGNFAIVISGEPCCSLGRSGLWGLSVEPARVWAGWWVTACLGPCSIPWPIGGRGTQLGAWPGHVSCSGSRARWRPGRRPVRAAGPLHARSRPRARPARTPPRATACTRHGPVCAVRNPSREWPDLIERV